MPKLNRHEEDIVLFRGGIIWVLERFEDYRERVSKARGLRKGRPHSIDYHALTNQTSADLLFFQGVCGATKMNVLTVTLLQMGHPQAHR